MAASLLTRCGGVHFLSPVLPRRGRGFNIITTPAWSSSSPSFPHRRLFCTGPQTEPIKAVAIEKPPPNPKDNPEDAVKAAADLLDIRVGRVLRAWRHPDADSLYIEEVDVGEPEVRTICSGLVNYIPLEHLEGKNVIVLANLKPRNMRGVKSNGMLMASSDAAHENVELLQPPDGSVPGQRIWFGSEDEISGKPDAATPNQVQKKKIWESVQPHLKTTESCEAVLLGVVPMRTMAGVVSSISLRNANIS